MGRKVSRASLALVGRTAAFDSLRALGKVEGDVSSEPISARTSTADCRDSFPRMGVDVVRQHPEQVTPTEYKNDYAG